MCLQSIYYFFSAESSVVVYALRHRAQQYSGRRKKSLCHRFPFARFPPPSSTFFATLHTAFFQLHTVGLIERILPILSHIPPAHSRQSLLGCKVPFHSCRLYASVIAHSSIPAHQVLVY